MKKPEKTCRQLFDEFCSKYSVDEVAASIPLSMIYTYLFEKCKIKNGNYAHITPFGLRQLIFKHLGHQYQLIKNENPALV